MSWSPQRRLVIVEFPDMDTLQQWYSSEAYAQALAFRDRALSRRLLFVEGTLEPAFQARRDPCLLQVEPLEHGPRRFVLDAARVAFGDQRGPLRRQHVAVQRCEHLGAQRVRLRVGHLVGVLRMPGDRQPDVGQRRGVEPGRRVGGEPGQHVVGGGVHDLLGLAGLGVVGDAVGLE